MKMKKNALMIASLYILLLNEACSVLADVPIKIDQSNKTSSNLKENSTSGAILNNLVKVPEIVINNTNTQIAPTPVPIAPTPVPIAPTPVPIVPTPVPIVPTPVPIAPTPVPIAPTPVPIAPTPVPIVPTPAPIKNLQGKIVSIFKNEIYVINANGTGESMLTNDSLLKGNIDLSPNKSKILYSINGGFSIYVMNIDGTEKHRLTFNADFDPSWSPDGSKIIFASNRIGDNDYQLYIMNADGSEQTRLTTNLLQVQRPSWSPDGSKIIFASQTNGLGHSIYVMNADGSNQIKLADSCTSPVWSPDGSKIAFVNNINGGTYIMNADGSNQVKITPYLINTKNPTWSPDGAKIAFVKYVNGESMGIYIINVDGSGESKLTNKSDWYFSWK